jgi:hypothetical protein
VRKDERKGMVRTAWKWSIWGWVMDNGEEGEFAYLGEVYLGLLLLHFCEDYAV